MEVTSHCNRRRFCCRLLGSIGAFLCSGHWPAMATSPYGRPLEQYSLSKLPTGLQPRSNPHLIPPHRQLLRFGMSIAQRAVPGVVFTTDGDPVRAVASGIVHFIGQRPLIGDGFGGFYIRIAHDRYDGLRHPYYPRVTLYRHQAFRSTYYGLQSVSVEHWQSVQRGQVIGRGSPAGDLDEPAVKLVLEERGNPVNPDDYGSGHGFMHYVKEGEAPEFDLEKMHRRLDRQVKVIERLDALFAGRLQDGIHQKIHGFIDTEKFSDYPVIWSTVEKLRYLEHLLLTDPKRFPGLSSTDFDSLKRTFLENQPIVLTLPLTLPT